MRILVSDYSGHPFQVQLSRELSRRGHVVRHTFSTTFQTPKGNLSILPDDPAGFEIVAMRNKQAFSKGAFFRRRRQEIEIGELLASQVAEFRPDTILSSNAPLDTQRIFQAAARKSGARFVFWLQDIYSHAIAQIVPAKFPIVGHGIAWWYRSMEFRMLKASDHVIAITDDFKPILTAHGVDRHDITVIENWAPLDALPQFPRDNILASRVMPGPGLRIVYSGTLGYKHNPELLVKLAARLPEVQVHVFSEGKVADNLRVHAVNHSIANIHVHPWVAFDDLPKVLGGADIFIAVIECEAGKYSVPSKILTYLTIGRPILASMPSNNLAAKLLLKYEAGIIAAPGEDEDFLDAALALARDVGMRDRLASNARAYAERTFAIEAIADRFLDVLSLP